MTNRTPRWTVWAALAYLVAGFAAYGGILRAGFLADDWIFLSFAVPAHSPLVCFTPLVGRFIRPMVMLTYYVNYHLFALWSVPYHVTLVLLHVVNTYLVLRLALRLSGSPLVAAGAGSIFLLFAGHSEAVSWVAGAADPWLAFFLLAGLLLFARGLTADGAAWPLAGASLVFIAAFLAKESAVVAPALVCAWGAGALLITREPDRRRRVIARTLMVAAVLACASAAYLAMRAHVFGSAVGAYSDLNANRSIMMAEARAFLLRAFAPPNSGLAWLWFHRYDRFVFAGGLLLVALVWRARPAARGGLFFVLAAFAITLAPVIPLSISLSGTTSERFIYVPTVFSSILLAWLVVLVCERRPAIAAALIAAIAALQIPGLIRANRAWVAASSLFQTFMDSAITLLRQEAPSRVFMLTLPDNLRGTVVVRSAFHPALHVLAPDIKRPEERAVFVSSHDLETPTDRTTLTRDGNRFTVALAAGRFIEAKGTDTPDYRFEAWTPSRYVIVFRTTRRAMAAYTNAGRLEKAGIIDGVPFGSLDMPAQDAVCDGATLRFSGWALDDEPGVEVFLESLDSRTSDLGPRTSILGVAEWRTGTRPDVTGAFADFPSADRAEWDYWLPCADVSPGRPLRVRVVARDRTGQEVELGERTVRL